MSTVGSLTLDSQVRYVNEQNAQPRESIIFVNGIMNELTGLKVVNTHQNIPDLVETGALATAEKISTSIENQRVVLFYNPTFCLSDRSAFAGEDKISQLYPLLAGLIRREHTRCSTGLSEGHEIRILVIAHSHGALLTFEALKLVDQSVRRGLEVAVFGGAKLVPSTLARKVNNYIHETDLVSIFAQLKYEDNWLGGFFSEKREELFGIKSDANQSEKIVTSISTHEKIKKGTHPLEAQLTTLIGTFCNVLKETSKLEEDKQFDHAIKRSFGILLQELFYNVHILQARSTTDIHGFDTYLYKAIEVINTRT